MRQQLKVLLHISLQFAMLPSQQQGLAVNLLCVAAGFLGKVENLLAFPHHLPRHFDIVANCVAKRKLDLFCNLSCNLFRHAVALQIERKLRRATRSFIAHPIKMPEHAMADDDKHAIENLCRQE